MSACSDGTAIREHCRALCDRGLGWPPQPYTPGGWWRDEPLPICERHTAHQRRAMRTRGR